MNKSEARPHYHFTPQKMWMNDPNGLVYHNGVYHLFYQYYPEDIVWGPMHWGHAISKNLIDWEHKPIALFPDDHGQIFSGSAVVDLQNTSGLGSLKNPAMVAFFTYHDPIAEKEGSNTYQTQGIAYSLDQGDTWVKHPKNPILGNPGIKDFRDPKVFWHTPSQKWIMLLVGGDHLIIYNSKNLIDWERQSDFGHEVGAHGGVWECPDLFPLEVDGITKWVLLISINPGAPNGGSGTQYFVGDFDGITFTSHQKEHKWIDWGTDNYAGVTYNGLQDADRTFIAWMSNWDYGQKTPTQQWRGAMTLARKLSLFKTTDYYLKCEPIAPQYKQKNSIKHTVLTGNAALELSELMQSKIEFECKAPLQDFSLQLSNSNNEVTTLTFNAENMQFNVDRKKSGITDFEPSFANANITAPAILNPDKDLHHFSIYIDQSSIEFFADHGASAITVQVFPTKPYHLCAFDSKAVAQNFKFSPIKN